MRCFFLFNLFILLAGVALAQYDTYQANIRRDIQRYLETQDSAQLAKSYMDLASVKILGLESDSALYYYLLSRKTYEAIGDTQSFYIVSNAIGHWYLNLRDSQESKKYFSSSLSYFLRTGDSIMMAHAFANVARVFELKEQFDSADTHRQHSLRLAMQVKDSFLVMINLWILSENAARTRHLQEALTLAEDALRWSLMNEKNSIHYPRILANKAKILQLGASYLPAVNSYRTALNAIEKDQLPGLRSDILLGLSECYEAAGDFGKALDFRKQHQQMNERLLGETRQHSIEALRIQFETENKEKEISYLQREKQTMLADVAKRKKYFFLITIGAVGIAATTLLAFFINRKRLQQLQLIQQQQHEIHKQQLLEITQQHRIQGYEQMIKAQDRERERIGRDLHDSLGSLLSGIKMHFQKLHLETKAGPLLSLSEKTAALINDACEQLRDISHVMMPESLLKFGLKQALTDLAQRTRLPGLEIHLHLQESFPVMEKEKEAAIYHICAEALGNIVRHAGATEVFIHLTYTSGELTLSIEDNGKGFHAQEEFVTSYGIRNMKARTSVFGGNISIESAPQKGTVIIVKIKE